MQTNILTVCWRYGSNQTLKPTQRNILLRSINRSSTYMHTYVLYLEDLNKWVARERGLDVIYCGFGVVYYPVWSSHHHITVSTENCALRYKWVLCRSPSCSTPWNHAHQLRYFRHPALTCVCNITGNTFSSEWNLSLPTNTIEMTLKIC